MSNIDLHCFAHYLEWEDRGAFANHGFQVRLQRVVERVNSFFFVVVELVVLLVVVDLGVDWLVLDVRLLLHQNRRRYGDHRHRRNLGRELGGYPVSICLFLFPNLLVFGHDQVLDLVRVENKFAPFFRRRLNRKRR